MNLLLLILSVLSIIAFFLLLLLVFGRPRSEKKVTTDQQLETPTTQKLPISKIIATIIVIAIIAIPLGIFFLIPGDLGDKIEKAKLVIPGYEKISKIPVFADNFSDRTTAKDYTISIGSRGYISNGKYIAEGKDTTMIINRNFTDCDKITVKFNVKKIAGSGSSAFGCFIEDGKSKDKNYPMGYYDGAPQVLLQAIQERNPSFSLFKNGGIWSNKEYQVILQRTVKSDKMNLHFTVDSKSENNDYQIPPREPIQIGLRFISENNAKFEIDDLQVYAYAT